VNQDERIIFDAPLGATPSWKLEVGCGKSEAQWRACAKGEGESGKSWAMPGRMVFLFCFLQVWRGADKLRVTVMAVVAFQTVQCIA
jgi:hypothetical protein